MRTMLHSTYEKIENLTNFRGKENSWYEKSVKVVGMKKVSNKELTLAKEFTSSISFYQKGVIITATVFNIHVGNQHIQ